MITELPVSRQLIARSTSPSSVGVASQFLGLQETRLPHPISKSVGRNPCSGIDVSCLDRVRNANRRAVKWLLYVFLDAGISILVAWLMIYCISYGDVFSGRSSTTQSKTEFLTAAMLWPHMFFSVALCLMRSISLFRLHLISDPLHVAGPFRILWRMFIRTTPAFVVTTSLIIGLAAFIGHLSASWRRVQLQIFLTPMIYCTFVTATDIVGRRIYRTETVEGSLAPRARRPSRSVQAKPQLRHRALQIARSSLSLVFALFVPLLYVVLIRSINSLADAPMFWLVLASLALKAFMHEWAKWYIQHSRLNAQQMMAVLLCMPTVVIDTQVRILFLRFQTTQTTMTSTMGLAVVELVSRFSRAFLTNRKIERRRLVAVAADGEDSGFEMWKRQLQLHRVMELSAGMFAEYVAIGCSSAIMVYFGDHPQYTFRTRLKLSSSGSWLAILVFQVGVEIAVDFVSSVMEVMCGVDLSHLDQRRGFLLILFVYVTLLNVAVSSTLYLAE